MNIGTFTLGRPLQPYVIAEVGVNHEGRIELARRLVELAAEGGAHAVKFQTYKAEKLARRDSPAYWDRSKESTESQFKLFKKYDRFSDADYRALALHCNDVGVDFLSTPFDVPAVDVLAPLMPAIKIASADITNVPLLRAVARKGKPVILSTGAATLREMDSALGTLRAAGAKDVALLHCVLNYPTPPRHAQLGYLRVLQQRFPDCPIGYSDHVPAEGSLPPLLHAALLGAAVLEKHFTHDKRLPGNDHYHAMDREDLERFVATLAHHRELEGDGSKDLGLEQMARQHARRSIVAARALRRGEVLDEGNLITKRPGHGISAAMWDDVVGRTLSDDVDEDALIEWRHLR